MKPPKCSRKSAVLRVSFVSIIAVAFAIMISIPNGLITSVRADWGTTTYPGFEIKDIYLYNSGSNLIAYFNEENPNGTVTLNDILSEITCMIYLPDSVVQVIVPANVADNNFASYVRIYGSITSPSDTETVFYTSYEAYQYFETGPYGAYYTVYYRNDWIEYHFTETGIYELTFYLQYLTVEE